MSDQAGTAGLLAAHRDEIRTMIAYMRTEMQEMRAEVHAMMGREDPRNSATWLPGFPSLSVCVCYPSHRPNDPICQWWPTASPACICRPQFIPGRDPICRYPHDPLLAEVRASRLRLEGLIMSYFAHRDLMRDFGGEGPRPTITVLCGSTRFGEAFQEANLRLTLAGHIVLSIGCDMRSDHELWRDLDESAIEVIKRKLDELHKRKIDLADEVFVLDVDGYIGESTRSEIEYATRLGRPIRYLSQEK